MPERPYDKHGIPVYKGDVLKTFHYRGGRYRRNYYLYHVVVEREGYLYGVPASELGIPQDGGTFLLTKDSLLSTEIVQGYGPVRCEDFTVLRSRKPLQ